MHRLTRSALIVACADVPAARFPSPPTSAARASVQARPALPADWGFDPLRLGQTRREPDTRKLLRFRELEVSCVLRGVFCDATRATPRMRASAVRKYGCITRAHANHTQVMHSRWAMLGVTGMLLRDDASFSTSPAHAVVACVSFAELLRLWAERRAARRQTAAPAACAAAEQPGSSSSISSSSSEASGAAAECSTVYPGDSFDVLRLCSPHRLEDAVYSSWVGLGGLLWAQPGGGRAAAAHARRLKGAEIGAGRLAMCVAVACCCVGQRFCLRQCACACVRC